MFGSFAKKYGATSSAPNGLAIFPTQSDGYKAADALIEKYASKGLTIRELINKWAPASAKGNSAESTDNYVNFVSRATGYSPATPVSETAAPAGGNSEWTNWDSILFGAGLGIDAATGSNVGSVATGAASAAKSVVDSITGITISRAVAIILGLISVGAGFMLFKPVRETVISTATTAAKVAAA